MIVRVRQLTICRCDMAGLPESPSSSFSLGDVTLSPSSSIFASTPTSRGNKKRRRRQPAAINRFKKPRVPPGPPVVTCSACGKGYRSLPYYQKHLKMHALQNAAARVPNINVLQSHSKTIAHNTLRVMKESQAVGKWGVQYNSLVQGLLESEDLEAWELFVKFICSKFTGPLEGKAITLPSSMIQTCLKDVEKITSDFYSRLECIELLSAVPCTKLYDANVLPIVLCDFLFRFCDQFLIFLSRTLRDADNCTTEVPNVTFDDKDRRTIHYVAGSSIKGFCRFGRRYPKNKYWSSVIESLKAREIENPEIAPACDKDRAWTEILSRGALTFVGRDALEFFLSVGKVILSTEYINGGRALPIETILEGVLNGEAKYLWDDVIGSTLSQRNSLSLLIAVTKSFTHTYGRGVALKQINAVFKNKPFNCVPLRQSLAPRGTAA